MAKEEKVFFFSLEYSSLCYNDGDDYDSNHLALDESYFFNLLPLDQFSVEFARDIIDCALNKYKQTTIFALFLKKKMERIQLLRYYRDSFLFYKNI